MLQLSWYVFSHRGNFLWVVKLLNRALVILIETVLLTWFQVTWICVPIELGVMIPVTFVFAITALLKTDILPFAQHVVIKSLVILFMKFFGFVCDEAGYVLCLNHLTFLIARILMIIRIRGLMRRRWRCWEIPERGYLLKDYGNLLAQLTRRLHVLVQIILGNSFLRILVLFLLDFRINLATTPF
jgi:hypothetical protein